MKTRNQILSWVQTALVKAWNLYHTLQALPTEDLGREIIKESYQEVATIATENNQKPHLLRLPKIYNFNRPANISTISTRKCKWNRCHNDPSDHRRQQLQQRLSEDGQMELILEDMETQLFKELIKTNGEQDNQTIQLFLKEYIRKNRVITQTNEDLLD